MGLFAVRNVRRNYGPVTVLQSGYAMLGDVPCKFICGEGEPGAFFEGHAEIFQFEEAPDGTWRAWWLPTDPDIRAGEEEIARLYAARST